MAIGPPLGALMFPPYIKTDWGIPLFFLVPLALMAIPALRIRHIALLNLTASWLVISLVVLAVSPRIVAYELSEKHRRCDLSGAFRTRPRTDASLAHALLFALAGGCGLYRYRPTDHVLQP